MVVWPYNRWESNKEIEDITLCEYSQHIEEWNVSYICPHSLHNTIHTVRVFMVSGISIFMLDPHLVMNMKMHVTKTTIAQYFPNP